MSSSYNRTAAFIEFSKGTSLEEIAHALAIPFDILKRWEREDKWAVLAPSMPVTPSVRADDAERAMEKIKTNREKNLAIAQKLQEDLLDVATRLNGGELKITKVFANGTSVELDPSMRDRCDIALYAKNVADLSYRALGDVESAKNPPGESGLPSGGQITIVLPAPIAAPREARAFDVESEVVRLDAPALLSGEQVVDSEKPLYP